MTSDSTIAQLADRTSDPSRCPRNRETHTSKLQVPLMHPNVVVWLVVVSSADGLYAVALWRGCRGKSESAWGPFWPPMPRP
jgi:hypothetical protein